MRLSEAKRLPEEDSRVFTSTELTDMVEAEFEEVCRTGTFIINGLTQPTVRMQQFETFLGYLTDFIILPGISPVKRRASQLQMCEDFLLTTYRLGYTTLAELQLQQYTALEREWQENDR